MKWEGRLVFYEMRRVSCVSWNEKDVLCFGQIFKRSERNQSKWQKVKTYCYNIRAETKLLLLILDFGCHYWLLLSSFMLYVIHKTVRNYSFFVSLCLWLSGKISEYWDIFWLSPNITSYTSQTLTLN